MWQINDGNVPLTYIATYYYYKASINADLLALCKEDSQFGICGVPLGDEFVTRDRLDSVAELGFLREALSLDSKSRVHVLDIGSGYGRTAWRISQCFPNISITCTDAIPVSAFICEFYLKHRRVSPSAKVVLLPHLQSELSTTRVDVAIAINSITECPATAIEWWLEIIRSYEIRIVLVVPNAGYNGGRKMFSTEDDKSKRADIEALFKKYGYGHRAMLPKYSDPTMQRYGVSPTYYHLFEHLPRAL